jgi:hypothetical protein
MKVERKTDRTKGIPFDPVTLDLYEGLWENEDTITSRLLIEQIFELTEQKMDAESVSILWSTIMGLSCREVAESWSKTGSPDIKKVSKEIGRKARKARKELGQIINQLDIEHL